MFQILLLSLALLCFVAAAFNARTRFNVNLCAAGFALVLLSYLLELWVRLP